MLGAFAEGLTNVVKDCFFVGCIALIATAMLIIIKGHLNKIASFIKERLF